MKTNAENNNTTNNNEDSIMPWHHVEGKVLIRVPVSFDTIAKVGTKDFADQLYEEISAAIEDGFMTVVDDGDLNVEQIGVPVVFTGNDNVESMEVCGSREEAIRIAEARWEHYTRFDKKEGAFARASLVGLDEDGEYDGRGEYVLCEFKEGCE